MIKLFKKAPSFWLFNILLIFLVILLARDPFSGQNAISDLEPSPDAIHYLTPVKSLLAGAGFKIIYEGRTIPTQVPPLYSFLIIPFYATFHDPRAFYFLNVILVLWSVCLFYKLGQKLFPRPWILWLTLVSFSFGSILFWYPLFPMAENLLIFLMTASFFLLIPPPTWKKALMVGLLAGLFFATKYVAWVEGCSLILAFWFLVWQNLFPKIVKFKLISGSVLTVLTVLLAQIYLGYLAQGKFVLDSLWSNLVAVYFMLRPDLASAGQKGSLFYHSPFIDNLQRYLFGLLGGSVTVAGEGDAFVSPVVGFGGLSALLLLAWNSLSRAIFIYIFLGLIGNLLFLSAFRIVDARYFFAFIPGLTLLFGCSLEAIVHLLDKFHLTLSKKICLVTVTILIVFFAWSAVWQALKINWTHTDASVNLQTIQVLNNYFSIPRFAKPPVVITILSPYQIDFFSNHQYKLLPLSKSQYFTDYETKTWDIPTGDNYGVIYRDKLRAGQALFVSNYHTGPDFFFVRDFAALQQNFHLTKVASGCHGGCDLFQIDSY